MKRHEGGSGAGTIAVALGLVTVVSTSSWAATGNGQESDQRPATSRPTVVAISDRLVLERLHDANRSAIEAGRLAQNRGGTREVKALGRQLIADHTRSEQMIAEYLRRRGLDPRPPATATTEDADEAVLATKLGATFDRAFAARALADHRRTLDLLEAARNDTTDDELMILYDQVLTTERAHKRAAQTLPVSK
jgi:putative membrane protein